MIASHTAVDRDVFARPARVIAERDSTVFDR
jgi:hypothetical protein